MSCLYTGCPNFLATLYMKQRGSHFPDSGRSIWNKTDNECYLETACCSYCCYSCGCCSSSRIAGAGAVVRVGYPRCNTFTQRRTIIKQRNYKFKKKPTKIELEKCNFCKILAFKSSRYNTYTYI